MRTLSCRANSLYSESAGRSAHPARLKHAKQAYELSYLITNAGSDSYSLGGYDAPDGTYAAGGGIDIADGMGIAIFKTASTAAFNSSNACLGGMRCRSVGPRQRRINLVQSAVSEGGI